MGRVLWEFVDCLGLSGLRGRRRTYVRGQRSNRPRRSVEPIALSAKVAPRTFRDFFSCLSSGAPHLRDSRQWIVARDHADPGAIGVIDESDNSTKGKHTTCVQHHPSPQERRKQRHTRRYPRLARHVPAACAWVKIQGYALSARTVVREQAAERIHCCRQQNRRARRSRWKTALRELKKLGIDMSRLKSRIAENP